MKKVDCSEAEALAEVEGWIIGIVFHPIRKLMTIPKDAIIGLRKIGWLDLLQNKYGWLIRRVEK